MCVMHARQCQLGTAHTNVTPTGEIPQLRGQRLLETTGQHLGDSTVRLAKRRGPHAESGHVPIRQSRRSGGTSADGHGLAPPHMAGIVAFQLLTVSTWSIYSARWARRMHVLRSHDPPAKTVPAEPAPLPANPSLPSSLERRFSLLCGGRQVS